MKSLGICYWVCGGRKYIIDKLTIEICNYNKMDCIINVVNNGIFVPHNIKKIYNKYPILWDHKYSPSIGIDSIIYNLHINIFGKILNEQLNFNNYNDLIELISTGNIMITNNYGLPYKHIISNIIPLFPHKIDLSMANLCCMDIFDGKNMRILRKADLNLETLIINTNYQHVNVDLGNVIEEFIKNKEMECVFIKNLIIICESNSIKLNSLFKYIEYLFIYAKSIDFAFDKINAKNSITYLNLHTVNLMSLNIENIQKYIPNIIKFRCKNIYIYGNDLENGELSIKDSDFDDYIYIDYHYNNHKYLIDNLYQNSLNSI